MPTGQPPRVLDQLRAVALRGGGLTDGQLLESYVVRRDEEAFAALVRRHGPMVLGVCRRVVGDVHDAEDAFQATFLVLVRRAASVRPREQVGNWLYGVAYHTALKARSIAWRRRGRERQVDDMPHPPASPDDCWHELQLVLDEELARLPDRHRLPLVLCDLEGRPQRQVAQQLGLPVTTLCNRLAAARRLLARRLGARGVSLSAGLLATVLARQASAGVPPALLATTIQTAALATAGAVVPATTAALAEGVIHVMLMNKLKTAAAAVLAVGVLLAGLGTFTLGRSSGAAPPEKPVPAKAAAKAAAPAPRFHVADAFKCTACHMEVHDPRWHQKFVDVEAFGRWWQPEADDATFLRRLSLDLRGLPPSALETRLFLADSDPKKRKKLVELFLNDPQMHACHHYLWGKYFGQGKTPTGDREADWKRIREEINRRVDEKLEERRKAEGIPQRLGNLLTELIGNGRSDSQVLEALSLATLGRLPTQPEQQFALTHVKGAKERKVAFENVLWALLNSKECRDHAAALTQPTAGR